MRKSRFATKRIVGVLREVGADAKISDVWRQHNLTETTFHRWRRKSGGLQISEAKRLKALEEENRLLKRLMADQALNLQVVKDLLGGER